VLILETGLGGRLDATNAVSSAVSVITPIDLDHQNWLGDSIEQIASEKAGIIKAHTPVVSSPQVPPVEALLLLRAEECGAPIHFVDRLYDRSPVGLRGSHQRQNAAVAVAALRAAKIEVANAAVVNGLMSVNWPARFQQWDERTIIDGAHNPGAARVLAKIWREVFGGCRATIILAVLSDKDVRGICEALAPIADSFLLPPIRSERALLPESVAAVFSSITPAPEYCVTASIADALAEARARTAPILVTGSLHFAGEVLALLRGQPAAFEECSQ
jgi:dihydrofolate synthase / folylpolyglutamate synthase